LVIHSPCAASTACAAWAVAWATRPAHWVTRPCGAWFARVYSNVRSARPHQTRGARSRSAAGYAGVGSRPCRTRLTASSASIRYEGMPAR
jgi:hypothetical protein